MSQSSSNIYSAFNQVNQAYQSVFRKVETENDAWVRSTYAMVASHLLDLLEEINKLIKEEK